MQLMKIIATTLLFLSFLELRKLLLSKLKRDNNLDYKPTQICVANGAKQNIFNVLAALVNEGDEVNFASSVLGFL